MRFLYLDNILIHSIAATLDQINLTHVLGTAVRVADLFK